MSDTKKHIFMRFLYRTRDTLYQSMPIDIVFLTALIILFFKKKTPQNNRFLSC